MLGEREREREGHLFLEYIFILLFYITFWRSLDIKWFSFIIFVNRLSSVSFT